MDARLCHDGAATGAAVKAHDHSLFETTRQIIYPAERLTNGEEDNR